MGAPYDYRHINLFEHQSRDATSSRAIGYEGNHLQPAALSRPSLISVGARSLDADGSLLCKD
jgi:hypothetical protein